MVSAIGLMIGLYILMRYNEMSKNAGITEKILLIVFSLVTLLCIVFMISGSPTHTP